MYSALIAALTAVNLQPYIYFFENNFNGQHEHLVKYFQFQKFNLPFPRTNYYSAILVLLKDMFQYRTMLDSTVRCDDCIAPRV